VSAVRRSSRYAAGALAALTGCALAAAGLSTPTASATTPAATSPAAHLRDGRIAYANVDTGGVETVNPDGSDVRPVSPAGEVAIHPSWSPDGSKLAFAGNHAGDDFRLFTVNPDGSGLHMVVDDEAGWSDFEPAYTPDGSTIVYSRCAPDPPGGCVLATVHTDGTGAHDLTRPGDRTDWDPAVSPSGGRVAFTRFGYRGVIEKVWVMRLDGTHAHAITSARLEAGAQRWLPDGRHLLVTDLFGHLGENIDRIRDDGSGLTRLTHRHWPHNAEFAVPSPSGRRIVYSDDQAYPGVIGADLVVMRANGTGKHAITHDGRLLESDWGTAPLERGSTAPRHSTKPGPAPQRLRSLPPQVIRELEPGTQGHRKAGW
jgi:TolB protein